MATFSFQHYAAIILFQYNLLLPQPSKIQIHKAFVCLNISNASGTIPSEHTSSIIATIKVTSKPKKVL